MSAHAPSKVEAGAYIFSVSATSNFRARRNRNWTRVSLNVENKIEELYERESMCPVAQYSQLLPASCAIGGLERPVLGLYVLGDRSGV